MPDTVDQPGEIESLTLDTKYTATRGRVYITGSQALARLPMMQRQRDVKAGLNTAGYVSGYRGSPLGGVDMALWGASEFLAQENIKFEPGLNEDLAATAVWGSQQTDILGPARVDGVFGMWYGKNPGLDRAADDVAHQRARAPPRPPCLPPPPPRGRGGDSSGAWFVQGVRSSSRRI